MVHQWYKDNVPLPYGTHKDLSIENITPEHSGEYRCRVTNEFGQKISLPCRVRGEIRNSSIFTQNVFGIFKIPKLFNFLCECETEIN